MKQPNQHPDMYDGVDSHGNPHLLSPKQWRYANNVRMFGNLTQLPRKKVVANLRTNADETILSLSAIPRANGRSLLVAVTDQQVYQVLAGANSIGLPLKVNGQQLRFNDDTKYRRWSTTLYKNHLYFTNELNELRYTDGAQVFSLGNRIPSGRYVESFFEHMFVGWPTYQGHTFPTRLMWSNLHDFGLWDPASSNETDYVDFEEYCVPDVPVRGLTGILKLSNYLIVYTPTAILKVDYVGLPKVIQWNEIATDVGNGFPNTLISFRDLHFFYNILDQMFYAFDGEKISPIGQDIQGYWIDNFNVTDLDAISKVWAYVDRVNNEVAWCFKSIASDSDIDKAVVYNYKTGKWVHRDVENIHSYFWGGLRAKRVSELTNANSTYTQANQDVDNGGTFFPLFGSTNSQLLTEVSNADATSLCIYIPGPVLETGDYIYGDLTVAKESDSIVVHAKWDTALGLKVEYSVRDNLGDVVVWKQAGTWQPTVKEKRLSFPRDAGRVWRFRFSLLTNPGTEEIVQSGIISTSFSLRAELPSLGDIDIVPPPIARVLPLKFNGPVYAILPTLGGKIYVSGRFTLYGNDTDGWNPALGLCRLNLNGTLDSTFSNGTGFAITQPYYAPTQLQGTFDGGVICALSFNFLEEREVHVGVNNLYDRMFWNGGVVPPILKFLKDGTHDTTYVTDFLRTASVTSATRVLHAFHAYEKIDTYYYCYRKNVSGTSEYDGSPLAITDAVVLGSYQSNGLTRQEVYWPAIDGEYRMSVLQEVGLVAFCHNGPGNFGSVNAVVRYTPSSPWKDLTRLYYGQANYALWVFTTALDIPESSTAQGIYWKSRTPDKNRDQYSYYTGGKLSTLFQGVFFGSVFAGYMTNDSTVGLGVLNGGPVGEHKGLYHVQTSNGVNGSPAGSGGGTGVSEHIFDFTLPRASKRFRFEINPRESTIFLKILFAPDTPSETILLANGTRTSLQTWYFDWPAVPSDNKKIRVIVNAANSGLVGNNYSMKLWDPGDFVTTNGEFSLWDLRLIGSPLTANHGFETAGYTLYDNSTQSRLQVRPLWTFRDWSGAHGFYFGIDPACGIYVSGCFDKFKGVQVYNPIRHNQLAKIRYDGVLDTKFARNVYGTEPFTDAELNASQPGGATSKVICAVLSPDAKTLYVGGRFLSVNGNTKYCHIVTLDALTGEVLS